MGWLVLSRRQNEKVIITVPPSDTPTQIVVSVVEIRGVHGDCKARLGFLADRSVSVHRSELLDAVSTTARKEAKAS